MGSELSRRDGEWIDLVADLLSSPLIRWPDELVCRQLAGGSDGKNPTDHRSPFLDTERHIQRNSGQPPARTQFPTLAPG